MCNRYVKKAYEEGIRGTDLLDPPTKDLLDSIGITSARHVQRFYLFHKELVKYQRSLKEDNSKQEKEAKAAESLAMFEKHYTDISREFDKDKTRPVPPKMKHWSPLDVYIFLTRRQVKSTFLSKFIKPLALINCDGKMLLEIIKKEYKVSYVIL